MTPPAKRIEVQFVIERACPNENLIEAREAIAEKAPFAVRVWWPPEPIQDHYCKDYAHVYRVTPTGHQEVFRLFRQAIDPACCLCEHMGHVIE